MLGQNIIISYDQELSGSEKSTLGDLINHNMCLAHDFYEVKHMLNCKINSRNGGTFCKSAASLFLVFFLVQGVLVMSK